MFDPSLGPDEVPLRVLLMVIALAMLGGLAHFLDRVRKGELRAHWGLELACDSLYSLAAGLLVWYIAVASIGCQFTAAALAIVGGHLGARFMFMVQRVVVDRILDKLAADDTDKPSGA
jgi:uncharacterized membrane protein